MNIFKRRLIFIFAIVLIAIITVIVFISTKKSLPTPDTLRPTPSNPVLSPTLPAEAFSEGVAPSPIPPADFTGADAKQQLPEALKNIGEQKTTLRRLTPLVLDFAVIEFDYENDMFLVQLFDPREQSLNQFTSWRTQTYPALTEDKFIVY